MAFRRRRYGKRKRFGGTRRIGRRRGFASRGSSAFRRTRRIASSVAWKAIRRVTELKFTSSTAALVPGGPFTNQGTSTNLTTASIGNVNYSAGTSPPVVIDITHLLLPGNTQSSVIGNKILLHACRLNGQLIFEENQSTHDQLCIRMTVLRIKQSVDAAGITANIALLQSLFLSGGNTAVSTCWHSAPWDLKKVSIYSDKRRQIHATPATVAAQINCHFKSVPINMSVKSRRGIPMTFNRELVLGDPAIKVQNPILFIIQVGVISGSTIPVTNVNGAVSAQSGSFYLSFRDA